MKKESGITMLILVFTIIILIIITGVAFSFVLGERGGLVVTSESAFKSDMQQIKEKVDEKQLTYDLEEAKDISLFTRNIEAEILEDYKSKMRISCIYSDEEDRVILHVYYKPGEFTANQIAIMQKLGFTEDTLSAQGGTNTNGNIVSSNNTNGL